MSSLQKDPSGNFHICFRFGGRRFKRSLKTKSEKKANVSLAKLDERLWMLESGHLEIPSDVGVADFLIVGKDAKKKKTVAAAPVLKRLSLSKLMDEYFVTAKNGSLEKSTIDTLEIHRRHLERVLGKSMDVRQLSTRHLQNYINKRAKAKGKYGRPLCGSTIKKELVTLRTVINWANELELVDFKFTLRKLRFPKSFELLPFQTRDQIETRLEKGRYSATEASELWESLFLVKAEIQEVLTLIKKNSKSPFLYPMISVAAYSGVRRSELLRMKVEDVQDSRLLVRERKRIRGEMSNRFVPLTQELQSTLSNWLEEHPGGEFLFARDSAACVTKDVAHKQLKSSLKNSRWKCIKGFHVFRHSFISALAIMSIDQRIIDEMVGHTSEQQRKRYRHLTPDVTANAVELVFGGAVDSVATAQ